MTNKQVGSHGVLKVRETRGWISHHATKLQAKERAMERQWGEIEGGGRRLKTMGGGLERGWRGAEQERVRKGVRRELLLDFYRVERER
jgi:hypothetical protein